MRVIRKKKIAGRDLCILCGTVGEGRTECFMPYSLSQEERRGQWLELCEPHIAMVESEPQPCADPNSFGYETRDRYRTRRDGHRNVPQPAETAPGAFVHPRSPAKARK